MVIGPEPTFPSITASAGAAEENRPLVAHQLAAAAGEDGRPAGEACSLLLTALGREPSDAAALRSHAGQDRAAAGSHEVIPAQVVGKRTKTSPGRGGV